MRDFIYIFILCAIVACSYLQFHRSFVWFNNSFFYMHTNSISMYVCQEIKFIVLNVDGESEIQTDETLFPHSQYVSKTCADGVKPVSESSENCTANMWKLLTSI